jgi:hypothetical protein
LQAAVRAKALLSSRPQDQPKEWTHIKHLPMRIRTCNPIRVFELMTGHDNDHHLNEQTNTSSAQASFQPNCELKIIPVHHRTLLQYTNKVQRLRIY